MFMQAVTETKQVKDFHPEDGDYTAAAQKYCTNVGFPCCVPGRKEH